MTKPKLQNPLLKKLKKQVKTLKQKEEESRRRWHAALKKVTEVGKAYKFKLAANTRDTKIKIAAAKKLIYAEVMTKLEHELHKKAAVLKKTSRKH